MNDGGQAFPHAPYTDERSEDGMTLRDYFAARFMARAQSLSEDRDGAWDYSNVARCCYEMADAMLKARSLPSAMNLP